MGGLVASLYGVFGYAIFVATSLAIQQSLMACPAFKRWP
jgi:hypothetical protein